MGVTSDLVRRVWGHKEGLVPGFTTRYHIKHLVYFELTPNARAAIGREKLIKSWSRDKKLRLVEGANPGWLDLAGDWFPRGEAGTRKTKQGSSLRSE